MIQISMIIMKQASDSSNFILCLLEYFSVVSSMKGSENSLLSVAVLLFAVCHKKCNGEQSGVTVRLGSKSVGQRPEYDRWLLCGRR